MQSSSVFQTTYHICCHYGDNQKIDIKNQLVYSVSMLSQTNNPSVIKVFTLYLPLHTTDAVATFYFQIYLFRNRL